MTQAHESTPVRTRREASEMGLKQYWTGRPCQKGHRAMRYVVSGICTACAAGYRQQYATKPDRATISHTVKIHAANRKAVDDFVVAINTAYEMANPPAVIDPDALARFPFDPFTGKPR